MFPIWTLKLGTLAVTVGSTVGFWNHISAHVRPPSAPLKPKVVQLDRTPALDTSASPASAAPAAPAAEPAAAPKKKVVRVVVEEAAAQQKVQNQASVGAAWVANQTGMKPVQNTYAS